MKTAGGEFCTLAYLTQHLQVGFGRLERAVRELNIGPAYVENGCPHYDEAAVEKIRRHVRGAAGTPGEGERQ